MFSNAASVSITSIFTLIFPFAAAPPSCVLLPPLGAPGAPSMVGVLWMYPSMLRWTFGVLHVRLAFCLPSLSRLYCLFSFRLVCEFSVVMSEGDVGDGVC